eukprot:8398493-Alexandrium_andersonii.AAC.1
MCIRDSLWTREARCAYFAKGLLLPLPPGDAPARLGQDAHRGRRQERVPPGEAAERAGLLRQALPQAA